MYVTGLRNQDVTQTNYAIPSNVGWRLLPAPVFMSHEVAIHSGACDTRSVTVNT